MALTHYKKDPAAVVDYSVDWSAWLDGDALAASSWSVSPASLTDGVAVGATSHTAETATAWLSAGAPGENYTVTNRVTTAAGRTDERSFVVMVRDL